MRAGLSQEENPGGNRGSVFETSQKERTMTNATASQNLGDLSISWQRHILARTARESDDTTTETEVGLMTPAEISRRFTSTFGPRLVPCPVFNWCGEHILCPGEKAEDQWHLSKDLVIEIPSTDSGGETRTVDICLSAASDGEPQLRFELDGDFTVPLATLKAFSSSVIQAVEARFGAALPAADKPSVAPPREFAFEPDNDGEGGQWEEAEERFTDHNGDDNGCVSVHNGNEPTEFEVDVYFKETSMTTATARAALTVIDEAISVAEQRNLGTNRRSYEHKGFLAKTLKVGDKVNLVQGGDIGRPPRRSVTSFADATHEAGDTWGNHEFQFECIDVCTIAAQHYDTAGQLVTLLVSTTTDPIGGAI